MKLSARLRPLPLLGKKPELGRVYSEIRADLDRVERKLRDLSRSSVRLISEVGGYLFQKSGKRIRPALVLLCSKAFGARDAERIMLSSLVELVHTASLIHDDIVDNAGIRRGKESVHAKWGPNITVLLGDYLYIKSIGLSLQSRHDRVIRLLADVSARLIEGELDEYALSGDPGVTEGQYLNIVENKTAVLFAACCRIGAVLGLASPEEEEAVASFGLNLGTTFQIVDDLLDFTGDPSALGKPVLTDIAEGRVTLPLIHALRTGDRARRRRLEVLVGRKDASAGERKALLADLAACGAFEYAGRKARDYAERSLEFLNRFPESTARETLIRLTVFILTRNR